MQHSDEEWFWERYHPDGQVPCACAVRVRQLCVCASAATPSVRPCPRPCPSLRTWFARLFVGACLAFVSGLLPACLPGSSLSRVAHQHFGVVVGLRNVLVHRRAWQKSRQRRRRATWSR